MLVENTLIPLPGMAEPLELARARIVVRDGDATIDRISGRLGAVEWKGEYRYRPKAARPHQFHVSVAELDATELERLLLPTLQRDEGFLARALRLGRSSIPDWLEAQHADGVLEIGSFALGDLRLANLRVHLVWDAANLEATEIGARWGEGLFSGRLVANLRRAVPAYRLTGRVRAVKWMGGQWDGRGLLETSGTGAELARNLRLEGAFKGRSVSLAQDTEFESVSGNCVFRVVGGLPQLRCTEMRAVLDEDVYQGQGSAGPDGRLSFDLSSGAKQLRLIGTLSPFQLGPG
jgi:hypothetical protein